ncbi:MAG: MotA/TolQ/ExbB proton channel family protein [Leptospiraceae bacterium]|nr:MotA/TolQ/ExbB proton channel family protein [Leptospiraceae bacterium]MCP5499526.1 MotA/TolQ/ExbB proton channel family protein [Leptospiraceae bacterium]
MTTRAIAYTALLLSALYFTSPVLISQSLPDTKDKVTNPAEKTPAKTPEKTEEKKEVSQAESKSPGLVDLFFKGGWSMYPLALASIIGLGVAFERLYFFFATRLISKGYNQGLVDAIEEKGLEGAKEFIETHKKDKISEVLVNGMDVSREDPDLFAKGIEREAGEVLVTLERGLVVLASVSTIAPLIGFLGTVSGMINAFDAIANADQVNAKVVAGGIKEALITTATGLIVAIPAMAFYQYLTGKVNAFAAEVEEAANRIYKEYLKKQATKVS